MKFVCLVHVDRSKFVGITEAEQKALDAENLAEDRRLLESGHLIAAGPLAEPETATLVRMVDGRVSMTDGPYVETKEHLGGLILIEAASREEAMQLLADSAMAKYGTLEIREHWSLEDYLEAGRAK
jgi:hypothetical protein